MIMKKLIDKNFKIILGLCVILQSCASVKNVPKNSENVESLSNTGSLVQVVSPALENITGTEEIWLGGQIQDKLKSNLQEYLGMRIVVDSKSEVALKKLQQESEDEGRNEETAIELGKISTAKFALFSKIRKTNNGYIISTDFTDLTTGEQKATATSKEYTKIEYLYGNTGAVDEITLALADKLGIRLSNKQRQLLTSTEDDSNYETYFFNNEIYVKGGTFFIGTKEHKVNDFFIAKTEASDDAGFPIVNKTWLEVIQYCNKLSEKENLESVYEISKNGKKIKADFSKNGYRLPTKEEWYWAATGAEKRTVFEANSNLDSVVWYIENSDEKIHRIAQKDANSIGIYDMFGNVAEWCWNNTADDYRIVCGGFYGSSEKYVTPENFYSKHKRDFGENYIGFRLVRSCINNKSRGKAK